MKSTDTAGSSDASYSILKTENIQDSRVKSILKPTLSSSTVQSATLDEPPVNDQHGILKRDADVSGGPQRQGILKRTAEVKSIESDTARQKHLPYSTFPIEKYVTPEGQIVPEASGTAQRAPPAATAAGAVMDTGAGNRRSILKEPSFEVEAPLTDVHGILKNTDTR